MPWSPYSYPVYRRRPTLPLRKRLYRRLGQMFMRWAETDGGERVMGDIPDGHEIVSSHSNEQDARYSAHSLLMIAGALAPGWCLYLRTMPSGSVDVVKYYAGVCA